MAVDWASIIPSLILGAVALIVSYAAYRSTRASHDLAGVRQVMYGDYRDAEFEPSPAFDWEGRSYTKIREAANAVRASYEGRLEDWERDSCVNSTPQQRLAAQLSLRLQRLGAYVKAGHLPMSMVLSEMSDQIVDDYLLTRAWADKYRAEIGFTRARPGASGELYYHRRNAELLALVSALWLVREWRLRSTNPHAEFPPRILLERLGGEERARQRLDDLLHAERRLMPWPVRRALRKQTNVR